MTDTGSTALAIEVNALRAEIEVLLILLERAQSYIDVKTVGGKTLTWDIAAALKRNRKPPPDR